jgi:hypothetical protein
MTIPVIMPDPLSFLPPFSFDICASETHETVSKPTEFPVELGANIADHIQIKPNKYTIIGVVTETPFGVPVPQVLDVPIFVPNPLSSEAAAIGAIGAGIGNLLNGPPGPTVVAVEIQPVPSDPVTAMHDVLLAIQNGKFLCSLTTTTQSYSDMCLTSVSMTRKDDEGKAEFTCVFEHILTVSSETVAAPAPLIPAGLPKVSAGAQTPTETTPAQKTTLLQKLAAPILGP